jgi:hypothetical protein
MLKWLEEEVKGLVGIAKIPFLMVLDQASFHRTEGVLKWLSDHSITPAIVPSGCTSLIQPLDTAINKAFKNLLRHWTEIFTFDKDISKWSARDRPHHRKLKFLLRTSRPDLA